VRYDLHSFAQVVAFPLFLYHMLIDLAGRDVVVPSQGNVQVSFVVSKVEVDFTTVVKDKALPVPVKQLDTPPTA